MAKQKPSGWLDKYVQNVPKTFGKGVARIDETNQSPVLNYRSVEDSERIALAKELARRQTYLNPASKTSTAPAMKQAAEDRIAQEKADAFTRKIAEGAQTIGGALELTAPFTGAFMPLVGGVGAGLGIGSSSYLAGKDALAGNYGDAAINAGFAGLDAAGFAALRNPMVKDFVQGADQVSDYSQVVDLSDINTNNIRGLGKEDISDIVKSWLGMPKPLSETTNKNSLKVLEDFKQRIQTPEGQRRLRELGIPDDSFLQKTRIVDDPSTLGVYGAYDNTIGINPNLPNTNFTNSIVRHEIEHGVQDALNIAKLNKYNKDVGNFKYLFRPSDKKKALEELEKGTTAIDDILSNVELRKTPEKVDWNAIKEERGTPDPSKLFDYLSNKQNATNYFDSGSGGQEKSAFLAEIQQYMLDNGYLKNAYDNVTPNKVKEVFGDAYFDQENRGKYLRLFNIMKPTDKNYELISEGLNKMLSAPAIIGAGATAATLANEPEGMKNGGWLEKYNDGGPIQPNYNDYSVSAGPGFQGDGYSNVGRNYSPAWGGQFQKGGELSFISNPKLRNLLEGYQPGFLETVGDYRLPEGQIIPLRDPSTEVSMSIGGEGGEPSYLIPSFKYGQPLQDPVQEFDMTGQYLGGPFKTWQDAEKFGKLRHQYVEKGQPLPSPIATANMAMGGSIGGATQGIPGATGFMYARTGSIPSNGKYAKKTMASAQKGKKSDNIYRTITKKDVEEVKNNMINYVNSPLYRQRLDNYPENYRGDAESYQKKKFETAIANAKVKERAKQLRTIPYKFEDGDVNYFSPSENLISLIPNDNSLSTIAHELGHAGTSQLDVNSDYTNGRYWDSITNKTKLNPFNIGLNEKQIQEFNTRYSPTVKSKDDVMNSKAVQDYVKNDPHWNPGEAVGPVSFAQESYGDLMGVREALYKNGYTKKFGDPIDKKLLDKAKKDKRISNDEIFKRFYYKYGDDNLIHLNNTIASNDVKQGIPIAQKGKKASKQIPKEIPKVTTTKFLPPEIKPDEEVTKPEPAPEPTFSDTGGLTPEQRAKEEAERAQQEAEHKAYLEEYYRKEEEQRRQDAIAYELAELARKQKLAEEQKAKEEQEAAEYRALEGVYGPEVRKAEKELNKGYGGFDDYRINDYHNKYLKLVNDPVTKEKVEGIKKTMMDYINSPLYSLRQKNYPEQYNGVDQYVQYENEDEFQEYVAKGKKEARLRQIAKTPFIELGYDDNIGPHYNEQSGKVGLMPDTDRATIAHEYGHVLTHNKFANDEAGNVMKDENAKGILAKDKFKSSDLYNSKYWDGSPIVGKGLGYGLNQNEIDAFVQPAASTERNTDEHYDKEKGVGFAGEQYGDLSGMRKLFLDYGITKSYGEDIDQDKINKARQNKNITTNPIWKRFSYRYSPEDIIKLNNTIAANNSQQGIPMAQNGMEMSYYQNGLDFTPKSISKNGSVIKDDMGQWAHPGEITEIGSNQITMQGVPYPVLGISDTGDTQMMYPNQEYEFIGDSVTEYPMMQNGGWLDSLVDAGKSAVNYIGGLFEDPAPAPVVKPKVSIKPKADTYDTLLDLGFNNPQSAKLKNLYKTNRNKTYLEDKNKVALNTGRFKGANVSAALIDDIALAAKRNKIPVLQLLTLAGRESTFGQQKGNDRAKKDSANNEYMSGWNVAEDYSPYDPHRFLADKKVPGIKTLKSSSGYYYEITDEKAAREYLKKNPQLLDQYKKKLAATPDIGNRNYFDLSAEFLKKKGVKGYNPGDPTYVDMFNQDYNTLKQDKELMSYLKKKGYTYKQGGQLTKLDQLTNFTNYNTKQPGGWLDKYQ